ncbi:hypothetical protein E8E12_001295 [Didymella heteroderae]|uniref:Uncharacterized protein n=1 Tax=Didymella heteroderae TaxID=1769908 RepID=A0A9P5BXM2_9PLEO|nr:hypothetical protein E8E12_001295 [Didymella heteroderae]
MKQVLPTDQMALFENKSLEYRTLRPLRVCCADESCYDPLEGYENEGYEKSARGIHLDTGQDRGGTSRIGYGGSISLGHEDADTLDDDEYWGADREHRPVDLDRDEDQWKDYSDSLHDGERGCPDEHDHVLQDEENQEVILYDGKIQPDLGNGAEHTEDVQRVNNDAGNTVAPKLQLAILMRLQTIGSAKHCIDADTSPSSRYTRPMPSVTSPARN